MFIIADTRKIALEKLWMLLEIYIYFAANPDHPGTFL